MHNRELWIGTGMGRRPEVCFLVFFHDEFLAESKPNTTKEVNFDPSVDLSSYNKMRKQ